jgi:hypothetical protein
MVKQLEVAASVSIVGLAAVVAFILVKQYVLTPPRGQHGIQVGSTLNLPGAMPKGHGRMIVLALSTGCHYCTDSASFYRRLEDPVRGSNLMLAAVLPQAPDEGARYLRSLGLKTQDARQAQFSGLGILGTPTLLIVDGRGVVLQRWIGKLPTDVEDEVIAAALSAGRS